MVRRTGIQIASKQQLQAIFQPLTAPKSNNMGTIRKPSSWATFGFSIRLREIELLAISMWTYAKFQKFTKLVYVLTKNFYLVTTKIWPYFVYLQAINPTKNNYTYILDKLYS